MQRYAKQIKQALQELLIEVSYSPKEKLVYGLNQSRFGDIYCIFRLEKEKLTCFALFQPEVFPQAEERVLSYLEEMNKDPGGGYFYIDKTLSRITYAVDYELSKGTDIPAFKAFCTLWLYRFKNYRQLLYFSVTGSVMNESWHANQ